jgi:hypothetical protein
MRTLLASFSCFLYVSFANFPVMFRMFCSHRKVSLVMFSPISISFYTHFYDVLPSLVK